MGHTAAMTISANSIAFISDLHLAPRGMSRCTATSAQLLDLFEHMRTRADEIVVVGDAFDLSRPLFPGGWRAWLEETRLAFPKVVGQIESTYRVFGNHDLALRHAGVPEFLNFEVDGLRVRVQHGHQFDVALKQIRPLESAANFTAGWLVRARLDGVAKAMGAVPVAVEKARPKVKSEGRKLDIAAEGAASVLSGEHDVVVMGHSHRLRALDLPGGTFINTGSLCCGHIDWVLLKSDSAQLFRNDECISTHSLAKPSP